MSLQGGDTPPFRAGSFCWPVFSSASEGLAQTSKTLLFRISQWSEKPASPDDFHPELLACGCWVQVFGCLQEGQQGVGADRGQLRFQQYWCFELLEMAGDGGNSSHHDQLLRTASDTLNSWVMRGRACAHVLWHPGGLSGSCWPRPPLFTLLRASTSNSQKGEQLQESGACGHARPTG